MFLYCFCILSDFAKVLERKVWRVQEARLHNAARALSSPSRSFQLSTNLDKDFFRYCWRALARLLPILYNSEKKEKSVGCKIEDSRMEVPRYRSSPTSWDFFFSVFSSSEVLGKITDSEWTADCILLVLGRKERKLWSQPVLACFMSKATSVPQNHRQIIHSILRTLTS